MKLLGICGKAGSGKDTAATHFVVTYDWELYHFADPLKEACAAAFGIEKFRFYAAEEKEIPDPYWLLSPREIAQYVGTEMFRTFDPDFWIKRFKLQAQQYAKDGAVGLVIPDVRFENEAEAIVDSGGFLIELVRDGADGNVGIANHASEAGFNTSRFGVRRRVVENNGSIPELYLKLASIYPLI